MLLKDDMEKARDARKRDSETMPRELSDDNNPSSEQVTPDWGFDLYLESRACEHSISFKAAGNPAIAELTKPEYREETRLLLDAIQGDDMLRGFCIPASEQKEADEGQESDSKILEVWYAYQSTENPRAGGSSPSLTTMKHQVRGLML